jgi:hypothetical protein
MLDRLIVGAVLFLSAAEAALFVGFDVPAL